MTPTRGDRHAPSHPPPQCPTPTPRRSTSLGQAPQVAGRLRKAPSDDPVLSASSPSAGSATEVNPPKAAAIRPVRRPAAGRVAASDRVTSTAGKAKVGFYQAPDDTARARAAYDWTRPQEGHRSFSDFISAAVMREGRPPGDQVPRQRALARARARAAAHRKAARIMTEAPGALAEMKPNTTVSDRGTWV